ncbi:iron-sulfur cluster repair di-iron protein [Bacillus sp. P14.5]|uniref:iron-sulfur cluster repair di-iron protein n=1 Tax=Bacillus sp. P14.5 TaxID=1983400 RepID=UPI000DE911E0|nr:iron-sulfur cluster repair di-iron protein [Bacillus sp. P14.5]
MEQTFTGEALISDIVKKFPKASDLFKSYRIDFCCGGNRPLIEALEERKLSLNEVLSELNNLYKKSKDLNEKSIDWEKSSSSKLIDYIIDKHHSYLNEELPLLSPYVTKVYRVHGERHSHLGRVHKLFYDIKSELIQHTVKEETEDFPLILAYEENPTAENKEKLQHIISELETEHSSAGNKLKELREVTNDFTPPEEACGTYRLVYQRLEALESDLFEHIHLENNILFPRAIS